MQAVFGIHPVLEALDSDKRIDRIYLRKDMEGPACRRIKALAEQKQLDYVFVPQEKLNRLAGGGNHQGVVAVLARIAYLSLEDAVSHALAEDPAPLVLLLDGVSDVHNFGAIARSAECAGVKALFLPAKGGAAVNADAIRASAGALLRLPVCKVSNLKLAVYYLKQSGFTIVGATEKSDTLLYEGDFSRATAVIMGCESKGISAGVLRLCDRMLRIPLQGSINSLNVSAAAAIVLYEALRQRNFSNFANSVLNKK